MPVPPEYIEGQRIRVKRLFKRGVHTGFLNARDLADWYCDKLVEQDAKCKYCDTEIFIIRDLIANGHLRGRAAGRGLRGRVLEIEKDNPDDGYERNNCHLACYYCNNDKSYTLSAEMYTHFFGEARHNFFMHLHNHFRNGGE